MNFRHSSETSNPSKLYCDSPYTFYIGSSRIFLKIRARYQIFTRYGEFDPGGKK